MVPAAERSPRATIYTVAETAGVSIATVSRVLQGSSVVSAPARTRVLTAVDELGYVPLSAARSLAVRRHEAHGLLLPELSGPYYAELLMGFESRASELGQSVILLLGNGKQDLVLAVRRLATRVEGLAMLGSAAMPAAVARALLGEKPVVIIAGEARDGIEAVGTENVRASRHLTEHLFGHGRRRMLFIGDPDIGSDIRERYEGFVVAHHGRGAQAAPPVRVLLRESDGSAFADRVLTGVVEADALVCANDELALSIMARLQDGGHDVPGEIAVAGWDDVMAARFVRPGLTTVRQPVRALGAFAADRLHERVTGAEPMPHRQLLASHLIIRASCGCAHEPARRHTEMTRGHTVTPTLKVRNR